jgi:hypothetical protein
MSVEKTASPSTTLRGRECIFKILIAMGNVKNKRAVCTGLFTKEIKAYFLSLISKLINYFYLMSRPGKPILNKRIFWDVQFENLDYDARYSFIIQRVFERGDVNDIRQVRRYYGDEKIAQALLNAKFLDLQTLYLSAAVIGRPITDFRCYIPTQLNPQHWRY